MIYIAVFVLLASFTLLDLVKDGGYVAKRRFFWFIISVLTFISCIRWETGPDWDSYHNFFVEIDGFVDNPEINFFEPGFTLINQFFSYVGFGYTALLVFFAILTIGLKGIVFLRYGQMLFVLLFLYYCYYLADILSVRQFFAVSLNLFSMIYIERRKFWPFLLMTCIAATIHVTSAFFIFAYWLYRLNVSDKILYTWLIAGFIIGLIDITDFLVNAGTQIVGLDGVIIDKVLKYGEEGLETSHNNPYVSYALGILKRSFILPILIMGRKWVNPVFYERYNGCLNFLVFGNIIYFVFILSVPVITRLALPYLYMEIFLLSFLVASLREMRLKVIAICALIVFGGFRLYMFMLPYMDLYVPFQTIFDSRYDLNRY